MKLGKLIGIVGHAGAGKTTLVSAAINRWNGPRDTVHMNFSRPIRAMLEALGVPLEVLDDKSRWNEPLPILNGHSTRYAATTLGTEWGRTYLGQNIWTNIALATAAEHMKAGRNVVIDNVRFPSEMAAMENNGATFIAVKRAGLSVDLTHESEKHIPLLQDQCEYVLCNDYSIEYSADKLAAVFRHIIEEP